MCSFFHFDPASEYSFISSAPAVAVRRSTSFIKGTPHIYIMRKFEFSDFPVAFYDGKSVIAWRIFGNKSHNRTAKTIILKIIIHLDIRNRTYEPLAFISAIKTENSSRDC